MLGGTPGLAKACANGVAICAGRWAEQMLGDTAGVATDAATGVADSGDCPAGLTISDTAGLARDMGDLEALSEGVIGALAVCIWRWAEPRLGENVGLAAGVTGKVTGAFGCCCWKGMVVFKYCDNSFVAGAVVL